MLISIGLHDLGVGGLLAKKPPPMRSYPGCNVIVGVFGYTVGEYPIAGGFRSP